MLIQLYIKIKQKNILPAVNYNNNLFKKFNFYYNKVTQRDNNNQFHKKYNQSFLLLK